MSNTAGRDGGVQSVDRAISVLEIPARRGEAGVSEVATEIDVHTSTAVRLFGALEGRGLVEQAADRGRYRLGSGLIPLAGAVSDRLADELGETIDVAMLQEHWAVNVEGRHICRLTPLHCTSSGKVLLAHLPAERRAALLAASGLPRLTARTVSTGRWAGSASEMTLSAFCNGETALTVISRTGRGRSSPLSRPGSRTPRTS